MAALATAQGSWARSRAAGEVVAIAAFDYSSAFDTLDVEGLVPKLARLQVGDKATGWFSDYLRGRCQRVRIGAASSSLRELSFGVPQGSLLGPTLFIALTFDLPESLGVQDHEGITIYADDICIWSAHRSRDVVRNRMTMISDKLAEYALENSLSLNASKTQILWIGTSSPPPVMICGTAVLPQGELQLLGLMFDSGLTLSPYLRSLERAAGSLLALARRLLVHLPRGDHARDVVRSLVTGRLCYGSPLLPVRLTDADPTCQLMQAVQVKINDIARLLTGASRADRVPVEELLAASEMPSLNRTAVKTTVIETWKCLQSCDGPKGERNPLGVFLSVPFPSSSSSSRVTRSAAAGDLPPPLRKRDEVFVWNAVKIYNESLPSLRSAKTLSSVHKLALDFSSAVPL